ncbi:LysR family transcriptional regulator [Ensifer sp. LC13]|uniref:helix-turn-helix domain-containing protein n=1 Tax=unclassified Ensifer TaxID=2633371 RepID=UPI003299FF3E
MAAGAKGTASRRRRRSARPWRRWRQRLWADRRWFAEGAHGHLLAGGRGQGINAAARRIGLLKTTVSRRIARPEAELGARLFQRSTRQLRLAGLSCPVGS